MPYKSAILAAIEELKDHETGSPAAAIRRYMQDRKDDIIAAAATSAMANQHSGGQSAIYHTSAMDGSAQYNDHYKANTGSITSTSTPVGTGGGGSSIASSSSAWNETLFQTTLKSLLTKNILVQVNGSNYKYSDAYLKKRAERLREQMEEEEQHRRHHHQEYQQQKHHHYSLSSSAADVAATTSSLSSHTLFPREEPPKPSPKKKTLHAKVKLNEGEIITVINPPTTSQQQQHHNANEMMETEDDATMNINNNNSPMTLESDAHAANNAKESIKKQPHVKIIPRKVVGGTKKMYVS